MRHLPLWRKSGAQLLFFSPANACLVIPGFENLAWGAAGHHGEESIVRFKYMLTHLLGRITGDVKRLWIAEYDSFCVSPALPETEPGKVYANAFFNHDTDPRFTEKMFCHPMICIDIALLRKIVEQMAKTPLNVGGYFWDRYFGKVVEDAGIEIVSFAEQTGQGFSINTIHESHYPACKAAVVNGARIFHGVKDKAALDLITKNSPWILHSSEAPKSIKYISFSLWGDKLKYTIGAIENVKLAKTIYPGWKLRFYMPESEIGSTAFVALSAVAEVKIIPAWLKDPMFARYLCADDPTCERVIFRDCDSRLSAREAAAVDEWANSGRIFHTMRDHPAHCRECNGGMVGIRNGYVNVTQQIQRYWQSHAAAYSGVDQDQNFLCRHLWPLVKNSVVQHDSHSARHFPGSKPFPTKREGWRFCGEVVEIDHDGNETFRAHDWPQLQDVIEVEVK